MLTSHQFFALVVRLFAAWLLLTAGQIVLVSYAVQRGTQDTTVMSYAVAAMYIVAAVLLWMFPLAAANRILPKTTADRVDSPAGGDGAAIVFMATGLLIIALKALTPLANYLSLLTMLMLSGQSARLSAASMHIDGFIAVVMLLAGVLLVLKSRSLALFVLRGR